MSRTYSKLKNDASENREGHWAELVGGLAPSPVARPSGLRPGRGSEKTAADPLSEARQADWCSCGESRRVE